MLPLRATRLLSLALILGGMTTAAWAQQTRQPVYQQPVAQQPVYQQPVYQQPAAQGIQQPAAQQAVDTNTVAMLIRTTLSALNDANRTGNYTVFRDMGSPAFQQANTAARLSEIFANLRKQNLNMAPIMVVTPQLSRPAQINQQGMLSIAGVFPTQPLQITFDLLFQRIGVEWKLFGIQVGTPKAPAAQTGLQPQQKRR